MELVVVVEQFLVYLEVRNRSRHTVEGYEKDLRIFRKFLDERFRVKQLEDIREEHLEAYIRYLAQERRLQPRSQNRYLSSISSMYIFAMKKRFIQENVMSYVENVQYVRRQRAYLTPKELEQLIQAIEHPVVKTAVLIMTLTGLRISELLSLKLEQVDFEKRQLLIEGKGKKERLIPISQKLHVILAHYLTEIREARSPYVMATWKTGRLSPQYVNTVIRKAAKVCDFNKKVTAHTLRHTFASHLVLNNVSLAVIQNLLGHENIRTTSIYLHVDDHQLRDAVNSL